MPAVTGPIQIVHIGNGILQFGDAAVISPKSATKSYSGAGAVNTAVFIAAGTGLNATNVLDLNGIDQPIADNN